MEIQQILVVDDDPFINKLLKLGLEDDGFQVTTATCSTEASEQLRTHRIDLVLCDHDMPDGNGLELLRYASQLYPHLPFIMVTGRAELNLARDSIAAGALDFITKPFEISAVVRRIEQSRIRIERDRERIAEATGEVLNGAIRALVAAIDAKDPYTAAHSERVAALALCLGSAQGLSPNLQLLLQYSSLLHDIGKISVPAKVLTKPGNLDGEEWAMIRQHPIRSAEIIQQMPALAEVATIARHHHERLDGSGYPDGLVGNAIPLLARILAIADVYEALTADRAYRKAYSASEAKSILSAGSGTSFDAQLVDAFNRIVDLP